MPITHIPLEHILRSLRAPLDDWNPHATSMIRELWIGGAGQLFLTVTAGFLVPEKTTIALPFQAGPAIFCSLRLHLIAVVSRVNADQIRLEIVFFS